jgi:hypothetical protein
MTGNQIPPKFIRLRDAFIYLGMDRNRFNREVRPYVTEIPIGKQGIAFDRFDLDAWAEHYKHCNGHPAVTNVRSIKRWGAKYRQGSLNGAKPGILKKEYSDTDFEKALALSRLAKQNAILIDESRK